MLFNSIIFLVFLAIILPSYYLLNTKKSKNVFILTISYLFYAYWDWRFCFLLAFSTLLDFFLGRFIATEPGSKRRKALLLLSIFSNLGILAFFKYFNFFADSFRELASLFGYEPSFSQLHIILPIGLSFYTFQTMSYVIDVYRKDCPPAKNFIDFAVFVSFFPQLVAGPIERASKLIPQIQRNNKATPLQWKEGITLVIYGLFKKVLIGDTCGRFVDHIFGSMESYSSWECLTACLLFSIQIYADLSGYSNVARGVAKLLGFELSINFRQPYLSSNIEKFWRRWHITLSSWLRDYLYIPLGGNRKGNRKTYRNLMLTMLLGGLWHGAGWNFILWGGLHGLYLIIYKILQKRTKFHLPVPLSIGINFLLVMFAFVLFRVNALIDLSILCDKLLHFSWGAYPLRFLSILLSFYVLSFGLDLLEKRAGTDSFIQGIRPAPIRYALLTVLFGGVIICILLLKAKPFIYFQF